MSRALIVSFAALLAASVAGAQAPRAVRPIPVQPLPAVQPAPAAQATQVAVPVRDPAETDQAPSPIGPVETLESVKAANRQLRENNKRLRNENGALTERITQMTTRGGSQVRAWCPSDTISRSTAGDEANCEAAGYTCEPVSGLCRTSCQTSDMCSINHTCDPVSHSCVDTTHGAPGGDDD
jgi:hypothetical protein